MIFALAIHGAPFSSEAAASALRFAEAALAAGHTIPRVFFYHDGVHTASALSVPPQDEASPVAGWTALAREHGVELLVCIAASLKRGLVSKEERARHELMGDNLLPPFALVGLGQLIEAVMLSDRLVTFAP